MLLHLTVTYKQLCSLLRFRGTSVKQIAAEHGSTFSNSCYHSVKDLLIALHVGCSQHFFTWWLEKTKTKAAPAAVRPQVNRVPTRAWITGLYPSNMVPDLNQAEIQIYPRKKCPKETVSPEIKQLQVSCAWEGARCSCVSFGCSVGCQV